MNNIQKYLSTCLFATAALLGGASPAWAKTAPSLGAASSFAVLAGTAVTCTDSTVTGDVGAGTAITQTNCTINGTVHLGGTVFQQAYADFLSAYGALANEQCDYFLSGNLAGVTLYQPGVYCVTAASTTTGGTLTLVGSSKDIWIFKIGTDGTGALTGTNFSVVLANGTVACNVYWWVAEAATMTDSDFKGTILAGTSITLTGGTFAGRALAKAAVTLTNATVAGCGGGTTSNPPRQRCNQGVGNGFEGCDPGNSNQGRSPFVGSNDEFDNKVRGTPGSPGKKGGNFK